MKPLIVLISFILISCGFSPIDSSKKEPFEVFIFYEETLLNNQFISEMRKKGGFLNFQFSDSRDADIKITILEHTITKYTGATDRNFFAATGTMDYEISMQISNSSKSREFNFRSSEIFPYDTNKILSNEKKMEELQLMFFFEAQNQLRNFLYLYFND